MLSIHALFMRYLLIICLMQGLSGCQKEELPEEKNALPLNSFTMRLNGQAWEPSQIGEDACMRTFNGAWSAVGKNGIQKPYYTIAAYRDPKATGDFKSENAFKLQITDVKKPGTYYLTGSYQQDFESYALFIVNKPDGTSVRYINKLNRPSFTVEVSDLIPLPESVINGIAGTFYGTLYNENNSLDSLTFSRGSFVLKKVNWYNFNQCAQ